MLSGFFQEYLDKTDQTNLLTSLLRHIYSIYPNLSKTNVRVVRAAEEHEMQRGQTPFSWLNPQQPTRALRERAAIMFDPLNGSALVIPRVANAHFTTYIFHPGGVAYYDSLSFSPDTSLILRYHEALNKFYLLNPELATQSIKQTLNKIVSDTPVRMPCTKQFTETTPWSCGYCSTNVCVQAVLQQSVPTINQPLSAIYELQATFLKYKITGQPYVWDIALQALTSPPSRSLITNGVCPPPSYTSSLPPSQKPNATEPKRSKRHSKKRSSKQNQSTSQMSIKDLIQLGAPIKSKRNDKTHMQTSPPVGGIDSCPLTSSKCRKKAKNNTPRYPNGCRFPRT